MLREWRRLHPLHRAVLAARNNAKTRADEVLADKFGNWALADLTPSEYEAVTQSLADGDSALSDLRKALLDAQETLDVQLGDAAADFPILWRLVSHNPSARPAGVVAFEALHDCSVANKALAKRFDSQSQTVWVFPTLIHWTMDIQGVPPMSVAWTAVEEELRKHGDSHLLSSLSLVSGMARMGVAAAVGLGVAVAAPPVAVAVALADILINIGDAAVQYQKHQLALEGSRAALDPALSLTAAPDTFGAALTIAIDLFSILG